MVGIPRLIQRFLQLPLVQRILSSPAVRPAVRSAESISDRLLDITSLDIPSPPVVPNETGRVVLGSFPRKELGTEIGARTFQLPKKVWGRMTDAERWTANQRFLDRAIARGDTFITTDKLAAADDRHDDGRQSAHADALPQGGAVMVSLSAARAIGALRVLFPAMSAVLASATLLKGANATSRDD
jgi:hypothetical protein